MPSKVRQWEALGAICLVLVSLYCQAVDAVGMRALSQTGKEDGLPDGDTHGAQHSEHTTEEGHSEEEYQSDHSGRRHRHDDDDDDDRDRRHHGHDDDDDDKNSGNCSDNSFDRHHGEVCCVTGELDDIEYNWKERSECLEDSGTPINGNLELPDDLEDVAHAEDEPTDEGKEIRFREDPTPLFPAGLPRLQDIDQRSIGDCWLLASLLALIAVPWGPQYLVDSMHKTKSKVYVRLWSSDGRDTEELLVETPADIPRDKNLAGHDRRWVMYVEKALASYRVGKGETIFREMKSTDADRTRPKSQSVRDFDFDDGIDYQNLNGAPPFEGLALLTGTIQNTLFSWSDMLRQEMEAVVNMVAECKDAYDDPIRCRGCDCEEWIDEAVPKFKELKASPDDEHTFWEQYHDYSDKLKKKDREWTSYSRHYTRLRIHHFHDLCKSLKHDGASKGVMKICGGYMNIFKDKASPRRIAGKPLSGHYSNVEEAAWEHLQEWHDDEVPITLGARSVPRNKRRSDGREVRGTEGLHYGHAYALIDARKERNGALKVMVGNPHGDTGESRGYDEDGNAYSRTGAISELDASDFLEHFALAFACVNCDRHKLLSKERLEALGEGDED